MVGGETALAENWIPFQDSDTTLVDTDSYVDSGLRSSLSIKSKAKEGDTISNIEFDKNHRTYRVAEMKTLDAKGAVTNDFTYSDDPQNWSALVPHSFGMNLYSHYVENPLPRFTNPQWLVIYKEEGVRFHGSTYDVEKIPFPIKTATPPSGSAFPTPGKTRTSPPSFTRSAWTSPTNGSKPFP